MLHYANITYWAMMAVHMNDCVPNISLPCFCISYLIMLVTTRKKNHKTSVAQYHSIYCSHFRGQQGTCWGLCVFWLGSLTGLCTHWLSIGLESSWNLLHVSFVFQQATLDMSSWRWQNHKEKQGFLSHRLGGTTGAVFLHYIGQSKAGGQVQRQRQRMLQS